MCIMAVYDITGIQDYIFSSNRMKENIGASYIVQQALETYLPDVIREIDSNTLFDWKNQERFEMPHNESVNAEIVYIGGGNAMVAFRNRGLFNEVNRRFSEKLLDKTAGQLRFATGWTETEFGDFKKDRKEIFKKLNDYKSRMHVSAPLRGISITREGITDGLPAQDIDIGEQDIDNGEYISHSAFLKRKNYESSNSAFRKLLEPEIEAKYSFPKDFDDLVKKDDSSFMAVVHIDGNNMGKTIENITGKAVVYEEAISKIREISADISKSYENAMKKTALQVIKALKDPDVFDQISDGKHELPLRPVVLNGDDVTFVCNAKIGIPCVETFLKTISNKKIKAGSEEIHLSACAGVAMVKSHFPFYRAYRLSEHLCQSAKLKGKIVAGSPEQVGCWFDYHIVMSGVTSESLADIRKYHYNSPGMCPPNAINRNKAEFRQYNLLWRPWCIEGELDAEYEKNRWEHGRTIFDKLSEWPRSKLKSLRNEFMKSEEEVKTLVSEFESRDYILPEQPALNNNDPFINRQTSYMDILEIMDLYIKLFVQEETGI